MPLNDQTSPRTATTHTELTKKIDTYVEPDHLPHPDGVDHPRYILAILSLLMAFASISTDLYLPAMPVMAQALHASPGLVELTVSGYLVGFSVGQLFWGPVGDRYGRRLPVSLGLGLFVIGSAGCALSTSVNMLIGWRAIQALGACASVVLARAMVRDLYTGHRAARMMSTLMSVMAVAPLLGPTVGGQILHWFSWRAIFWTLVVVGLLTLLSLLALPETLPASRRKPTSLRRAVGGYLELLGHRGLLGYAGAGGFFYGGMFAYVAGTPFAYITYHHVPARIYGLLFAIGTIGIMITNMINARLVHRFGSDGLMRCGTGLAASAGMILSAAAWFGWGGLWGLVIPLFLFISATGFVVANSISGALGIFPERAGTVSALIGAIQYGAGIAGSGLVGVLADGTPWPLGYVIALFSICSFFSARFLVPN
jgi:MFS transporter, DHA1 family, multidrug resistance protein